MTLGIAYFGLISMKFLETVDSALLDPYSKQRKDEGLRI